jgi:ADP-ribosylglycohydrolase
MIGAISGDIIGSVHEGASPQAKDFALFVPGSTFTDDTVLTVAVASAIRENIDFANAIRRWGRRYPDAGYGGWFRQWLLRDDAAPYNSFGNGSAMRVAAIGWAFDDLEAVIRAAERSAVVSHSHPEGIKGAQAVAGAVFLGRTGAGKDRIAALLVDRFSYDLGIELSVLHRQCLQARIPDRATLIEKGEAWANRCNVAEATVYWRFTTEDARIKLHKLYPLIDI